MHEYDAALKVLPQASTDSLLRQLTGVSVARWLNVEMSQVLRMAEYSLRIYRQFKKFPKRIVLYVGERKLGMNSRLSGPDSEFQYTVIDARDLDGSVLLASKQIEDNLMAVLTRLDDRTGAIREILGRIVSLEQPARRDALAQFLVISGVRRLGQTIK